MICQMSKFWYKKKVPLLQHQIHYQFGASMIGDLFFFCHLHDREQLKVSGHLHDRGQLKVSGADF